MRRPTTRSLILTGLIAGLVAVAIVVFRSRGPGPKWELALGVNQQTGTPWSTFQLEARITPPIADAHWRWRWRADGVDVVAGTGASLGWRSGVVGKHQLALTVTSDRGVERSQSVDVEVQTVDVTTDFVGQPPPAQPRGADLPFGFSDVVVEKNEVCIGEPTTIRFTPKADDGKPGRLVGVIAGSEGTAGSFSRAGGAPGVRQVELSLFDPDHPGTVASTSVYVKIKDCAAPATVVVESAPAYPPEGQYAFTANLRRFSTTADPTTLDPATYSFAWDYNDGKTEVTTTPKAWHTFPGEADRPANEHFHTYLVSVEARDASGTPVAKGYASVFLRNDRLQLKDKFHNLELVSHFQDLGHQGGEGDVTMNVTLDNPDPTESVRLTDVSLRIVSCAGTDAQASSEPVEAIFKDTVIGPKTSVTGTFTFHKTATDDVCRVLASVTGISTPGAFTASGSFGMTVGEFAGSAAVAKTEPVTDKTKLDLLKKVSALLGTSNFTIDDIRRLENEGKIPRGVLTKDPGTH